MCYTSICHIPKSRMPQPNLPVTKNTVKKEKKIISQLILKILGQQYNIKFHTVQETKSPG